MTFASLGLAPEVLKAVSEQGYEHPTLIQAQAIPVILSGRDVLGAAQTGTGKTAAFTLPILTKLAKHGNTSASPARHPIRVLILTPTRELADQVSESVTTYSKHMPLRSHVVFGGMDIKAQIPKLREGVEILVATPGRLLDHIQQKTVNLSQVEILILDEADRMLDMGFILDIRKIFELCTSRKQTLLFSATFAPEIKKLAEDFMHDPEVIEVARQNSANESVKQELHPVENNRKKALVAHLIRMHNMSQVIVFCRTKIGAEQLGRELKRAGFSAEAIHGDRTQQSRLETLAAFKDGSLKVLVATDVAARGLDINELPFVINFELPTNPEDYIHRIGRTGRAGSTGIAISLVAPEEEKAFLGIQKMLKRDLPLIPVPGFSPGTTPVEAPAPARGRERERERMPAAAAPAEAALIRNPNVPPSSRARAQSYDNMPDAPLSKIKRTPQIAALFLPPKYPVIQ